MKTIILNELNLNGATKLIKKLEKEIKELKRNRENTDFNDVFHYLELAMVNFDTLSNMYETKWHKSNKYNNNTVFDTDYEIGFEYYDVIDEKEIKELHLYILDGNEEKVVAVTAEKTNWIEYKHYSFEEMEIELNKIVEKLENIKSDIKKIGEDNLDALAENEIRVTYAEYKNNSEYKNLQQKKGSYDPLTKTIVLIKE